MLNETLFLNENFKTFGDYTERLKESLDELFLNEGLSLDLNKSKVNKALKNFKYNKNRYIAQLNSKGIKVDSMITYSDKIGKELAIKIKKERFDKNGAKNINKLTTQAIVKIKRNLIVDIKNIITDVSGGDDVVSSIILLSIVICVNTMFSALFTILLGPVGGNIITAVLIAPITEEIGKLVAVKIEKDHSGNIYNVIFNVTEFTIYVTSMLSTGISLPLAIGVRIPAVIMHTVNNFIISTGYKKDIKNGHKEETAGSVATMITMCIHGLFNALASII